MKSLNFCDTTINIHDGKIGCSISGGADSTLLMYLLLMYTDNPIIFYATDSSLWPNRIKITRKIYNKCLEITKRDNTTLIETIITDEPSRENLFKQPIQDLHKKQINVNYTGITHNPPKNINFGSYGVSIRDGNDKKDEYKWLFYQPFINHDKRKIAEIYNSLEILDTVYPYTFSCVDSKNDIHCEKCWWCNERKWAFDRII